MIAGIQAEYQSDAGAIKDTPYLALKGELWGVFCEYFLENWPCYNSTTLYFNATAFRQYVPGSHGLAGHRHE